MSNNTTTSLAHLSSVPAPRGTVTYASYAAQGDDGLYYPMRSYPAFLLGIMSDFDVETLVLVDEFPISFPTYDEAQAFASDGLPSRGRISLGLVSRGSAKSDTCGMQEVA